MGKLAKAFANIVHEQDFCFEPYEMEIIKSGIMAISEWEEQNKGCFGHLHDEEILIFPHTIGNITYYNKEELIKWVEDQQKFNKDANYGVGNWC
jgi:hypothetical protein